MGLPYRPLGIGLFSQEMADGMLRIANQGMVSLTAP